MGKVIRFLQGRSLPDSSAEADTSLQEGTAPPWAPSPTSPSNPIPAPPSMSPTPVGIAPHVASLGWPQPGLFSGNGCPPSLVTSNLKILSIHKERKPGPQEVPRPPVCHSSV